MDDHTYDPSPLRAALEGFMEEITPSELLDPARIAAHGRERRRRRQFGMAVASTLAVIGTAGTAYALSAAKHGQESAPAAVRTTATAPAAAKQSAAALPGTPLSSGTTEGVAWKTSVTLADFQGGPDQQACVHVWTSDGSTNPAACTVTIYPGYDHGKASPQVATCQPAAISAKLGVAGLATFFTTRVHVTYSGGSFSLATLSLPHRADQNNEVTAVVLPLAGDTESGMATPSGPTGTGMTTPILVYATPAA